MSYFPSGQDNNGSDCGGEFPTDQNYISQPFHFFYNENSTSKKHLLNTYQTTKSNIPTIKEEPNNLPSYLDPSPPENTKNSIENDRFQSDNLIGSVENNNYDENISARYYVPKN